VCVCVCVCLCVRILKGKWLELSTSNLVHTYVYLKAGARYKLIPRLKGQRFRSQSYQMCCQRRYAGRYDCILTCWFL